MKLDELIPGKLYLFRGETYEFSYVGGTGLAIIHPEGEPDMQSCIAVEARDLRPVVPTSWEKLLEDRF